MNLHWYKRQTIAARQQKLKRCFAFLLSLVVLIGNPNSLMSMDSVAVSSNMVKRGEMFSLVVSGDISANPADTVEITFHSHFDAVRTIAAFGSNQFLFQSPTPGITERKFDDSTLEFTVRCEQNDSSKDTICIIQFEALASSVSFTNIVPVSVAVNGIARADIEVMVGSVRFIDKPVLPGFIEGIGTFNPNPFAGSTIVNYSISFPTTVVFRLYNIAGMKVKDFPVLSQIRGNFQLPIQLEHFDYANGLYFLQMITERDAYSSAFLFLK